MRKTGDQFTSEKEAVNRESACTEKEREGHLGGQEHWFTGLCELRNDQIKAWRPRADPRPTTSRYARAGLRNRHAVTRFASYCTRYMYDSTYLS
jgi:hypothetical protein